MEKERKIKTISVIALIVAVLGLTVAFAVLSTNLVINGTAKVDPATWKIYFDNFKVESSIRKGVSLSNTISEDKMEINFSAQLSEPKDEVIYLVDIVNESSINAKIDNIQINGLDNDAQKLIDVTAYYKSDGRKLVNGDVITKNSTEKLKIKVSYKDINNDELPKEDVSCDFTYKINYVQTEEEKVHSGEAIEVYSLGQKISLGTEEFYVLTDNIDTVTAIAKENVKMGYRYNYDTQEWTLMSKDTDEDYGRQSTKLGNKKEGGNTSVAVISFSDSVYWLEEDNTIKEKYQNGSEYPFVYDENSKLYPFLEEYKSILQNDGFDVTEISLLNYEQTCLTEKIKIDGKDYPKLVKSAFWTGHTRLLHPDNIEAYAAAFGHLWHNIDGFAIGIRPVITVSKSSL